MNKPLFFRAQDLQKIQYGIKKALFTQGYTHLPNFIDYWFDDPFPSIEIAKLIKAR